MQARNLKDEEYFDREFWRWKRKIILLCVKENCLFIEEFL
jgi:hypothetical protein